MTSVHHNMITKVMVALVFQLKVLTKKITYISDGLRVSKLIVNSHI